jgi:hypothetical protein
LPQEKRGSLNNPHLSLFQEARHMKITPTLTAVAALALAGTAFAQDTTRGGVPGIDVDTKVDANISMPMADKNSDGKISKTEAAGNQKLSQQFDTLDKNKDGSLDKGEFAKFEASAKGAAKGNKDGAPGKDEGDPATKVDRPGTTDDSVPGNEDKLGPGR